MPTSHFTRQKIKQRYNLFEEKPRYQTGILGNAAGVVRANRNHYVYVRLRNGEVVEAYNDRVPSTAGRPVILRWERGRWLVENTWQVFDEPLWNGVGEHAETHELYGSDPLFVRAGQILPGLVIPKPGELAVVVCHPLTELYELLDLSAEAPESGAIWALVECNPADGAISARTGGAADSYGQLNLADIPEPTGIALAALKLYNGQQEFIRSKVASDIIDLRWYQTGAVSWISTYGAAILAHLGDFANPHNVNKSQVGLGNVDNTNDLSKPVSFDQQAALDGLQATLEVSINQKAPLESPTFTGKPKAPTLATSDSSTLIATTAFVKAVINAIRFLLPFSSYNTLGSPLASTPLYPYAATLPGFTIYPKQWNQGLIVGATNDASNYWTFDLLADMSGTPTVIASFDTKTLSPSTTTVVRVTSFRPTSLTQADNKRLAVRATRTGSASNISAHGPALEYQLAA